MRMGILSNLLVLSIAALILINSCSCQTNEDIQLIQRMLFPHHSTDQSIVQQIKDFLVSYTKDRSLGDVSLAFPALVNDTLYDLKRNYTADYIRCHNATTRLFSSFSIENLYGWPTQFLDAWGKVPPGVVFGDFNWLGSYQQCIRQHAPANKTAYQEAFSGQYCTAAIYPAPNGKHNEAEEAQSAVDGASSGSLPGGATSLSVGTCFPDTCTAPILSYIVNRTLQNIPSSPVQSYVYCQPTEAKKITTRAAWVIALLSLIGALVVAGTFYDLVFYRRNVKKAVAVRELAQTAQQNGSVDDDVPILNAEQHTTLSRQEIKQDVRKALDKEQNVIGRILMCFSILNNCQRLFTVATPGGDSSTLHAVHGIRFLSMSWVILGHTYYFPSVIGISLLGRILMCFSVLNNTERLMTVANPQAGSTNLECVHGIRFLSMSWVILGHTFAFVYQHLKNGMIAVELIQRFTFQALLGATVSVDSFFVLSGLLITFLALREMKSRGGVKKFNWVLFYVHRYWRLTVPYMIILGVNAALFEYMGSGPMWPVIDINANCKKSWWTNLLYVNNLVHKKEQCFGWAWYLANDMQFYWITPLFLIPLFWKWWAGLAVSLTTLLVSLITTGVISAHYRFPASLQGQVVHPDRTQNGDYFGDIYTAPWCRIGPYMVGVLCGYVLYKTNRKVKMHRALALLGWCLAATINMLVVYGLYRYTKREVELSVATEAFYNAVHRSAWGVGLCWVIFACVTGYGGLVNKLLSWSALVPLSRLTYMAYLVHPIVIFTYNFQLKYLFNYDDYSIIYLFLGNMVMAYSAAFVACILFEAPFMALEKVLLGYVVKRNKES